MTQFKKTEIGLIPDDWELIPLSLLASNIVDGTHFTPTYQETGVPFLRVTDIQTKDINLEQVKRISVFEHQALNKRCNPRLGDILLSKNGTVGIPKIVTWSWPFSIFVSLCLIKLKSTADSQFISYVLESPLIKRQIHRRAKQGTVTNLHLEEVRDFLIPSPPRHQQRKIAKILTTVDNLIEKTEALIAKYQAIKQGMMHDLFTRGVDENGKLRPPYEEAPDLYKQSDLGWIPREWEVLPANKVCSGVIDCKNRTPPETEVGFPVIKTSNVRSGRFVSKHMAFTDRRSYEIWTQRGKPKPGDILITREAPVGEVCMIPGYLHNACLGQRMMMYQPDPAIMDADFMSISLQSLPIQKKLLDMAGGSTVGHVRVGDIKR